MILYINVSGFYQHEGYEEFDMVRTEEILIGDSGNVVFRRTREMDFVDLVDSIMESAISSNADNVFVFQDVEPHSDMSSKIAAATNKLPPSAVVPIAVASETINTYAVQKMHRLSSNVAALVAYIRNMGCGDDQVPGAVTAAEQEISGMSGQLEGGLKWICSKEGKIKWKM